MVQNVLQSTHSDLRKMEDTDAAVESVVETELGAVKELDEDVFAYIMGIVKDVDSHGCDPETLSETVRPSTVCLSLGKHIPPTQFSGGRRTIRARWTASTAQYFRNSYVQKGARPYVKHCSRKTIFDKIGILFLTRKVLRTRSECAALCDLAGTLLVSYHKTL